MAEKKPLTTLMLAEFFYPHAQGGSEWSVYFLSRALIAKGHKVVLLTPNYGKKKQERWKGINIFRFNIFKKLKGKHDSVTPFWHTNIFWFFQNIIHIVGLIARFKVDVIHVQGKYFLPAAVVVGKLKKIPVVFTGRDYQILCSLGFCLWDKSKKCNLFEYFFKEVSLYNKFYQSSSLIFSRFLFYFVAVRSRLVSGFLLFFAKFSSAVVCISKAQQKIYSINGLQKTAVIYNSTKFFTKQAKKRKNQIVFIGRLTPGKGAHLLVPMFFHITKTYRYFRLTIVGSGFLREKIIRQINKYKLNDKIVLTGRLSFNKVQNIYKQSKLAVFPALWSEPFGRGVLEAIANGCPVVTSDKGGLYEIAQNKYGKSVKPTVLNLSKAMMYVLENHGKYVSKIKIDRQMLKKKFNETPAYQYEDLYYKLLKKR